MINMVADTRVDSNGQWTAYAAKNKLTLNGAPLFTDDPLYYGRGATEKAALNDVSEAVAKGHRFGFARRVVIVIRVESRNTLEVKDERVEKVVNAFIGRLLKILDKEPTRTMDALDALNGEFSSFIAVAGMERCKWNKWVEECSDTEFKKVLLITPEGKRALGDLMNG